MVSLTDEIPNQLSLEKDCHGSSSVKPGLYKKNKVSASRRFPPQCGTKAEPIPPEALLDMMVCIDDRVALHAHANSFQSGINVLAWSSVLQENQFKARGKVSAIRDFPPNCATNDSTSTEMEHAKIIYETESLAGSKIVGNLSEVDINDDYDQGDGFAGKEIFLDAPDISSKGISSHKVSTSGRDDERVMAAPDCPWVKQKVTSEGRKSEGDINDDYNLGDGFAGKEIFLHAPDTSGKGISLLKVSISGRGDEPVMMISMKAEPNCPWVKQKASDSLEGRKSECRVDMHKADWRHKHRVVAKKSTGLLTSPIKKQTILHSAHKNTAGTSRVLAARDEGLQEESPTGHRKGFTVNLPPFGGASSSHTNAKKSAGFLISPVKKNTILLSAGSSRVLAARDEGLQEDLPTGHRNGFTLNLPPYGGASSSHTNARDKVKNTLRLFRTICKEILQREEAKSGKLEKIKRIDLEALKILKEQEGVELNTDKKLVGSVPGVEVGDEYQYRVELIIVGVHQSYQAGIDYTNLKGAIIATSIVSSGAYDDGWDNSDVLIYSGQGGNIVGKKKEPKDQKLKRGNLALKNSVKTKNPVRVIRGLKETNYSRPTLVYDGLYTVEKWWAETGLHGKKVYKFELRRNPGQPELAWKSRRVL